MRNILNVDLTNQNCNGVYSSACDGNCSELLLNVNGLELTNPYLYFILPKIRYKALVKMKGTENEYTFCEDVIKIVTTNNDYNGTAEINYSLLVKVCETSKYFFLFQTKNQVLVVDKSTIENGTADDVKNKLISYVRDKYTVFIF